MCFMCSSVLCCTSFPKSTSKSQINGSHHSLSGQGEGSWQRSQSPQKTVIQKQVKGLKQRPLPPTPNGIMMEELIKKSFDEKAQMMEGNVYEDVRNANLTSGGEIRRPAPSGTPSDLLEEWVRGLHMDYCPDEDEEEDSTSFSDMSTQTEWTTGWEPLDGAKGHKSKAKDNIYDIPQCSSSKLTKEEIKILDSRLNWLGSQSRKGKTRTINDRRSVTLPTPSDCAKQHRSTVRSMTVRGEEMAENYEEFRQELSSKKRDKEARRSLRRQSQLIEKNMDDKILNCVEEKPEPRGRHSSETTTDNNASPHEEQEEALYTEPIPIPSSSKRSSGTCSCSNSSCSCSCCSDAWWLNQDESKGGGLSTVEEVEGALENVVSRGMTRSFPLIPTRPRTDTSSSASSGYLEGWGDGFRKSRAMTNTSYTTTTTSSSGGGPNTGWSSFKPESDEWVFVVSTSLSSAPEDAWVSKERLEVANENLKIVTEIGIKQPTRKEDSLGYGTLPPSESELHIRESAEKKKTSPLKTIKDKCSTLPSKPKDPKQPIAYFKRKNENRPKSAIRAFFTGKGKVAKEIARLNSNENEPQPKIVEDDGVNKNKTSRLAELNTITTSIRDRTSSLGRDFKRKPPTKANAPGTPSRAALTSPEVTPKRSARKTQLLRERAMQIEVERSQHTSDDEDIEFDPDETWIGKVRGQVRRRRRSNSGEARRPTHITTPGIGQLLMVQAEYAQRSQDGLTRDSLHITAV